MARCVWAMADAARARRAVTPFSRNTRSIRILHTYSARAQHVFCTRILHALNTYSARILLRAQHALNTYSARILHARNTRILLRT